MITATPPITLQDIQNEYGTSGIVASSTPAGLDPLPTAMLDFLGRSATTISLSSLPNPLTGFDLYDPYNNNAVQNYVNFNPDGTFQGAGHNQPSFYTGNWLSPTTSGVGSNYWIRFTRTFYNQISSGASTTPSSGWLSLTIARPLELFTYTGIGGRTEAQWTIEISSNSSGSNIVYSITGFTMYIDIE